MLVQFLRAIIEHDDSHGRLGQPANVDAPRFFLIAYIIFLSGLLVVAYHAG